MIPSGRIILQDQIIDTDLQSISFHNHLLTRIGAKGKKFTSVDFSHTYFENCYFRNCVFDSCNFNGCKFSNCNLKGSTFPGSNFDYASFEKSIFEKDILHNNCPSHENQTLLFARSLRVNFQSLGEVEAVNDAILIELSATKKHLYDAWNSKKAYYRKKYTGLERIRIFFKWLYFKFQEFIWGNGERPFYLIRFVILLLFVIAIIDVIKFQDPFDLRSYWLAIIKAPSIFFGTLSPTNYPTWYLTVIVVIRLVSFAMLVSIVIKRFNRR